MSFFQATRNHISSPYPPVIKHGNGKSMKIPDEFFPARNLHFLRGCFPIYFSISSHSFPKFSIFHRDFSWRVTPAPDESCTTSRVPTAIRRPRRRHHRRGRQKGEASAAAPPTSDSTESAWGRAGDLLGKRAETLDWGRLAYMRCLF